ncbi:HET-domain-containing protein [Ophiobolus disseminans]|uniref:HET-domain-containing protein n=1 Tax=Ophiobolus disseminans TaxID=1469910 RepID=A0A6A6ZT55_9PLEO|nr:HET-domain-containing protein [Ophiobolus disseminans]
MTTSAALNAYEYSQLPNGGDAENAGPFIRYLVLHAGSGDDPLECTLRTVLMADTSYEAVSYVWGSDVRDQQIICDGRTLALTTNLFRVLKRIRQPDAPRSIWADLICIDQDNLDEKGHQVGIMGQIYRHASRVLIHMGDKDQGHGPMVCSLLNNICYIIDSILPLIPKGWNTFPYPRSDEPILTDPRWDSLLLLLEETWFTRGWVVREAGFAQDGQVFWGDSEFSWVALMKTLNWLYKRGVKTLYAKGFDSRIPLAHLEIYEDRNAEYAKLFTTEMTWVDQSLLGYLSLTRQLNLKDPRDRIYAFLELVENEGRPVHLRPNYKDSYLHVYQQFAPTVTDDTALKVKGVIVDTVLYASEALDFSTTTIATVVEIWKAMEALVSDSPYPTLNRLSVFIGVLTAGTREGDVMDWLKSDAAYYRTIYENHGSPDHLAPPSWLAEDGSNILFHNTVKGYTHNRKITLSERGYMGLAPSLAQKGDSCGIIFGCTTPCILRPTELKDNYQYLGATFVVGQKHWRTSDGRVIFSEILGAAGSKDWSKWDVEEQDIYLC